MKEEGSRSLKNAIDMRRGKRGEALGQRLRPPGTLFPILLVLRYLSYLPLPRQQ
jgi:hypothetical protein